MKIRLVRIVIGAIISAALIFAGFTMYRSHARDAKMGELRKSLVAYCEEVNETTRDEEYEKIRVLWNSLADVSDEGNFDDLVYDCSDKYFKPIPTTTLSAEPSEAEAVAEGRTCSKQWNYAHSETVSGWDQDVQLRGTLYACASVEDWTTEAIDKGEWSEFLLKATCALEARAPKRICG